MVYVSASCTVQGKAKTWCRRLVISRCAANSLLIKNYLHSLENLWRRKFHEMISVSNFLFFSSFLWRSMISPRRSTKLNIIWHIKISEAVRFAAINCINLCRYVAGRLMDLNESESDYHIKNKIYEAILDIFFRESEIVHTWLIEWAFQVSANEKKILKIKNFNQQIRLEFSSIKIVLIKI